MRKPFDRDARERGKKITQHKSEPAPGVHVYHDVRLSTDGLFSARYLETWYSDKVLDVLKKNLDEACRAQGTVEWAYYIEVREVGTEKENSWYAGHRLENFKIRASWRAVMLSSVIQPPESAAPATRNRSWRTGPYRLCRSVTVTEEGAPVADERHDTVDADPGENVSWVPFTMDRWRALGQIRDAARRLGRNLREVMHAGAFLDDVAGGKIKFLTASTELRPKAKEDEDEDD